MCCQEKSYSYTLHKNWIKFFRNHIVFLVHFETWNHSVLLSLSWCHSLYHSQSLAVTHYHFLLLIVSRCHLLSFVEPLAVVRCHSLYYLLSLIVTRCATPCHLLSFDVPLVCIFINVYIFINLRTASQRLGCWYIKSIIYNRFLYWNKTFKKIKCYWQNSVLFDMPILKSLFYLS